MKKTNIILIVVIAILMGVMIVSLMGNSRTYASFESAAEHPNISYDIVGTLDTTKEIVYNAKVNADEFSFYMYDQDSSLSKVIVSKAKPQDFEKSTQVVATGKMKEGVFKASSVLLKCPSKYEGGSPSI
ncbi:MAG TPA: cytochrome c maturation protein CcmE [Saprospiraceae bacterium]|nr:cytochrome c maturation protein CcmE [Saprospiraceae bacterium]